jgi:hypothetical protein
LLYKRVLLLFFIFHDKKGGFLLSFPYFSKRNIGKKRQFLRKIARRDFSPFFAFENEKRTQRVRHSFIITIFSTQSGGKWLGKPSL